MPRNDIQHRIAQFGGLLNANPDASIGLQGFLRAVNVDVNRGATRVRRRPGTDRKITATITAGWNRFYIEGTSLKMVEDNGTAVTTLGTVTASTFLTGYEIFDRYYLSTGNETRVVEAGTLRTLGLVPPAPVEAIASWGSMPAGRYRVAASYVRDDGQESGLSDPSFVELYSDGGIAINFSASSEAGVVYAKIYVTTTNGTELFFHHRLAHDAVSTGVRGELYRLHDPARFMNHGPPGVFQAIAHHNGRMLYGVGDVLWYSVPFGFELIDNMRGFVHFPGEEVRVLASVDAGVFVGTDRAHYYLGGKDIAEATFDRVATYGAPRGSTVGYFESNESPQEGEDQPPMWVTRSGIVVGGRGVLSNLTHGKASFTDDVVEGAGFIRRRDNQVHYIAVVKAEDE